jgi:hypothetical protein
MKTSTYKLAYIRQAPTAILAIIALATLTTTSVAQNAPPATGPAHSSGDAALTQQIAELQAKVHQLEAMTSSHSQQPGSPGAMGGMQAGGGMSRGMGGMQAGGGMSGMGGMEGMQNMMGPMEGMEMMGMMSGMPGMQGMNMPQSALPGFPGASHLYHIGATGFFLDHAEHIALSTDQQVALNKIKEQALASKSSTERQIEQAEQELATLTASDQPDLKKIETKIRDIAKLSSDERIAFIKAVGEGAKLLTDQQRKILTGFASPAPGANSMPMPSASPDSMPHM